MIISAGLPTCMEGMMYPVPFASPADIIAIGQTAEACGFHSVWGNDHMTTQHYVRRSYPTPPNFWEILMTLGFVAAHTQTLRLGTGMLITPMRRDIVVTAKQVATLDAFSQGRVILGVGVGAYREEFEALRPEGGVHRGDMLEESIQAFRVLFGQRHASFKGQYYHFEDVEMYPKPAQNPLPLYVGGNNPNAMARAVRHAHGWMPAALTAAEVRARVATLKELAAAAGRDYREIDVGPQYMVCIGPTHEAAMQVFRNSQMYHHILSLRKSTFKDQDASQPEARSLVGTAASVIEQIQALEEAGVTHLCGTYFVANTVPELLEQMQVFAADVMPHVRTAAA